MSKPSVAIIGGGFAGLSAAIRVKQDLGINATIFEASKDIGGAWFANSYPNCGCDVPSHLYSLSTDLNPNWSQLFSPRDEILRYVQDVATRRNLYSHTRLETKIPLCRFYPSTQIPEQFKLFSGTVVHTASWDPSVDFTNKRVAVIGTGASAVQVLPPIARLASQLYSYQRTVTWCTYRRQYNYSRTDFDFINRIQNYKSFTARRFRTKLETEMRARIEKLGRPDLVPVLVPEYTPGCKRLAISDNYIEALCQSNVVVQTNRIKNVQSRTITTENGDEQEFDILILATGFNVAGTGYLGDLEVLGKPNVSLNKAWHNDFPALYKSTLVNGYPNMFVILGPSSFSGGTSAIFMGECQVSYCVGLMKKMIQDKIIAVEPLKEAQEKSVKRLKAGFVGTAWKSGCVSYYMNQMGDVTLFWSGSAVLFRWMLRGPSTYKDLLIYKKNDF
ncbi:hypothetical protein BDA99DRAFT_564308 [Phascolomyces articulosus]|uniref:Monooxygenase n=1 Tax=Phascolomyces articulosus TaxID=60185 RepID=A0AAD5K057_9FUNG|nr:hypothetical protein BDA99DRAFT_564308 [Phascolomyces articulosus]